MTVFYDLYNTHRLLITARKTFPRYHIRAIGVTSSAIIGRYERNERTPSIDIAMNIAQALNVSLDFLAGDTSILVKDKEVLQRIEDISNLSEDRKKYIYDFIDMCLRDYKTQKAYS